VVGIVGKSKSLDFPTMLIFWSLVRNSVVLAVYLLFSVACFLTVHEHLYCACIEPYQHFTDIWQPIPLRIALHRITHFRKIHMLPDFPCNDIAYHLHNAIVEILAKNGLAYPIFIVSRVLLVFNTPGLIFYRGKLPCYYRLLASA
ncbi:MAG: hypothetical protein SO362_03070, partial [Selenomonas montiformis]|nr:hypothetical protein [Selenomonas montiformis]